MSKKATPCHFYTLTDYVDYLQLTRPEHPMLWVRSSEGEGGLECPRSSSPPITTDCYSISLKKVVQGRLDYGRTRYDCTNGAMIFLAPRQVMQWDDAVVFAQKGFTITFHEDYLQGTELARQIVQYGFFSYAVNEALPLSPSEEQQMEAIASSIESEYRNNQDAYSKDIIIAHLTTLLKYADRFYERQFLHRKDWSVDLLTQFNRQLAFYYDTGKLASEGIPTQSPII